MVIHMNINNKQNVVHVPIVFSACTVQYLNVMCRRNFVSATVVVS